MGFCGKADNSDYMNCSCGQPSSESWQMTLMCALNKYNPSLTASLLMEIIGRRTNIARRIGLLHHRT